MTALAPATALAWLRSLSVDVAAAAVLDADGALMAGDPAVAGRARAALAADPGGGPGGLAEVREGDLLAVRSPAHVVAATVAPRALIALHMLDLRAALDALDAR